MDSIYRVYPCVVLGKHYFIGDFCSLGFPGKHPTLTIGDHAVIRSHTALYPGSSIGSYFATGHHVLMRENCKIGDYVSIGTSSVIEHSVCIGSHVRVHSQCFIPEFSVIEEGAWIGPGVRLTNAKYPQSKSVKEKLKGPLIGKKAIIGAGAIILPEVSIGPGALIGAGSVVTKDVKPGAVVIGNPAYIIKQKEQIKDYHEDPTIEFEKAVRQDTV